MLFCVAGVALHDILSHVSSNVSKIVFGDRYKTLPHFQKMSRSFRARSSTLETSIVILRGRRSTLEVSCCVFCANCIVRDC